MISTFWKLLLKTLKSNIFFLHYITLAPSSETQGQIKGARESLNGRKNIYGTKKSKEWREDPLGTISYQTSSKRSLPFWLLIGATKLVFPYLDFWELLICYRGHVPGPKSIRKPFAISGRLTDFSR